MTRTDDTKPGTGIGRQSAFYERVVAEEVEATWTERTRKGKRPGTHTLGAQFATGRR